MSYTPGPLPKETPPYIVRELHAIGEGLEQPRQVVAFAPTAVEPEKPRDGMMVKAVTPWDPGFGYGPYIYDSTLGWFPMFGAAAEDNGIMVALKQDTESTATGLLRTFYLPYKVEISEVIVDVVTAAAGSAEIYDVKISGISVLSTKPQIEAGEYSSLTGTEAVISTATHEKGSRVQVYCDQKGATTASKGAKLTLVWRKVS